MLWKLVLLSGYMLLVCGEVIAEDRLFRPCYHFTSPSGWMNDPNGLSFTINQNTGIATFHLFYQANGNQSSTLPPWAPGQRTTWGHATSFDLVHFSAAQSNIDGTSGATVILSPFLRKASGLVAVAFVGGLQMWITEDTTLANWSVVKSSGVNWKLVPATSRAARNGWDGTAWLSTDGAAVYTLLGGKSKQGGPQALLFRSNSSDLRQWEFVSPWYIGSVADDTDINCPDAFELADGSGRWAFIWLAHSKWHLPWINIWMIGTVDRKTQTFTPNARGLADQSSSFVAAQSAWWKDGRRVQFSWINTGVTGHSAGAQTLAREVLLSKDGKRLHFRPVAEVALLHDGEPDVFSHIVVGPIQSSNPRSMAPDNASIILNNTGGHTIHVESILSLSSSMPNGTIVGLQVLGGIISVDIRKGPLGWKLSVPGFTIEEAHSNLNVQSGVVKLDLYVDRSVVEVFVSDASGEGAIAVTAAPLHPSASETSVKLFLSSVLGVTFVFESITVWQMMSAASWSSCGDTRTHLKREDLGGEHLFGNEGGASDLIAI